MPSPEFIIGFIIGFVVIVLGGYFAIRFFMNKANPIDPEDYHFAAP